jgi:HSP20 family protein
MNLIPWRKKKMDIAGNGGELATLEDFPPVLRRMRNEFDELFDNFSSNWPALATTSGNGWKWGLEFDDQDDKVVLRAEAPGFEVGDFDLSLAGNRLILRANHKKESKEKGSECCEQCEYFEAVTLPDGIDKAKVDAKYHNGVLTISIPKTKEGRGHKIAVKAS